jgi:ketosteroid isomerase-like protein
MGSPPVQDQGSSSDGRTTVDYSMTTRSAYERLSDGDIDGFGALLADDYIEHEETPGFPPTKEGVVEFFRMYRAAFPDLQMVAEDVLISGDKCAPPVPTGASSWGYRRRASAST